MMSKKRQEILPWNPDELEAILRGLIAHGTEAAKVDFKGEIETRTPEQKSDLLKDLSAIANTYDEKYEDHGFLIYGITGKAIIGITTTEEDTDKFQNHIEQLLKTYISPMPQIYVVAFETDRGQKWGAIVIPPRNSKPHMFFKELSCPKNPTKSRKRGEWFVRRGSTTDSGLPEDLAVIIQKQTELLLEPLRESIRSLQSRVGKTEEQYNSALFKLVERAVSGVATGPAPEQEAQEEISANVGTAIGMDLSARLKQKLRTPNDAIAEELISEAKAVRDFLDGAHTNLPWVPQLNNAEGNKKIVEDLEERTRSLQMSVATIMLSDSRGVYTDPLLRSIKMLAKVTEVPTGIPFNRLGEALRYYPLGLILYTAFVCGVAADRADVLKQILAMSLKPPRGQDRSNITRTFFAWYDAKALFNEALGQRWCEPISQRIRQVINDRIGEMITGFSEPEYFFRGEFVLALAHVDDCINRGEAEKGRIPLPGLYLYVNEAYEVIETFVVEHPDWFEHFYRNPVDEILRMFDQNAHEVVSPNCFATGLRGLVTVKRYQESLARKPKE